MDAPVLDLGVSGAEAKQLVLDEERHHLGETDRLFLGVGEAGDPLALNQRLAVGGLDLLRRLHHSGGGPAAHVHDSIGAKSRDHDGGGWDTDP